MMPLLVAPIGKEVTITKCLLEDNVKRHLENLGVLAGSHITPVLTSGGDMIVKVHGSKLALNRSMASRIYVMSR